MEERIKQFFTDNPRFFGLFIVFVGVGGLVCAIIDVDWLYGDVNRTTYNLTKIDGWVNFFGRKTARILSGILSVVVILSGLLWFWLGANLSPG